MKLYIGVNKNNKVSLHTAEPVRYNDERWVSKRPYVNSSVQLSMDDMIKHSAMSWAMEPEIVEINVRNNYEQFS